MSLGSDVLIEREITKALIYDAIKSEAKTGIWETKDKKKIHVSDMSDSHIRNCINLIKKKDKEDMYMPWINRFEEELERRNNENT